MCVCVFLHTAGPEEGDTYQTDPEEGFSPFLLEAEISAHELYSTSAETISESWVGC